MNILGIDHGKKRIGLAWVQDGLDVVLPFGAITVETEEQVINDLAKTVTEEGIDVVVIGLPIGLDGKENEHTVLVRTFAEMLKEKTGITPEFVDERFSSKAADRLGDGGASRDEKAAMMILETYLTRRAL